MKAFFTLALMGVVSAPYMVGGFKEPGHPLSHKQVTPIDSWVTKTFEYTETIEAPQTDLTELIPQFVKTPDGGVSWDVFGTTIEHEYAYQEPDEEFEYVGVRPEFSEEMKKLDGTEILLQGYMFPLGQEEEQPVFLLGPFPLSCPYHYHVPPKLIIEVQAQQAEKFSYDAVNVKGTLELVPRDDEYNTFYRLKNAKLIP